MIPKTALIKNGLYWGFFTLSLYRKLPLSRIFRFIALSKTAFMDLYWKRPFSLYCFIENGLYWLLSKTAIIEDFLLYYFIKNGLYQGFLLIALLKTAFIGLYWPFSLYNFIKYGLYRPLSKTAFIKDFLLYQKLPLSRLFAL